MGILNPFPPPENSPVFNLWLVALLSLASTTLNFGGSFNKTVKSPAPPTAPAVTRTAPAQPIASQSIPSQPTGTQPTVKVSYTYYPIVGATMEALRSQMSQKGPTDRLSGEHFDANTDWTVQWNYRFVRHGGLCSIGVAHTDVTITFTLPKWKVPVKVDRSLVREWNRYMGSLQIHEDGHRDHGIAAGGDVLQALRLLPAYSSCQQLADAANSAARAAIKYYNKKDIEYDAMTQHGSTQGAVFPPATTVSQQRGFRG
jgi:predicted secreted Zn-dependent protease